MSDKFQDLTVMLETDSRGEDLEELCKAIACLRGVRKVFLGEPVQYTDHMARERVKAELIQKLWEVLK